MRHERNIICARWIFQIFSLLIVITLVIGKMSLLYVVYFVIGMIFVLNIIKYKRRHGERHGVMKMRKEIKRVGKKELPLVERFIEKVGVAQRYKAAKGE